MCNRQTSYVSGRRCRGSRSRSCRWAVRRRFAVVVLRARAGRVSVRVVVRRGVLGGGAPRRAVPDGDEDVVMRPVLFFRLPPPFLLAFSGGFTGAPAFSFRGSGLLEQ